MSAALGCGKPLPSIQSDACFSIRAAEAAKNVVMLDLAILQAEAAAGMHKKPVEVLAREVHYEPLPSEVRTIVIAAWTRGGLLPRAAIEQMVPEKSGLT
jgi:hypothetical protein